MDAERARSSHDDRHRSSKKKKHKDERRRHKHKHHHHHHHRHHKKRRHSDTSSSSSDDDAPLHVDDLEAYWVEKPTNNVTEEQARETTSSTVLQRPAWMLEAPEGMEGFTPVQHPKPPPPSKPLEDEIKVSERELNVHLKSGLALDQYPEPERRATVFGDAGSSWRMIKLKRTLELAEEQQRPVEEVALERYGSLAEFEEALAERAWLDGQKTGATDRGETSRKGRTATTGVRAAPTGAFRRPRHSDDEEKLETAQDKLATRKTATPPARPSTSAAPLRLTTTMTTTKSAETSWTRDDLNKLKARALKARLMNLPEAQALEEQYEAARAAVDAAGRADQGEVVVLGDVDIHGRLLPRAEIESQTGHRRKRNKLADTHDRTGERVRYGHAGEDATLEELVREERAGTPYDYNRIMMKGITRDAQFQDDLEYMDEQADRFATRRPQTTQQVRRDAINNYRRAAAALERCQYCFRDGHPPSVPLVSLGNKTFLALPNHEPLTPGHCLIVPIQHQLSVLECEDDVWVEIRNFMKCLLMMFHAQERGCLFMETVMDLAQHRHTVIECIPLSEALTQDAPAYFKEAILASDEEWSQHRKLYDTRERGFRQTMTPRLPYFHVWFTLDGGYGHVIENKEHFPSYFGRQVIAGMLDLLPHQWRKPRRLDPGISQDRVREFKQTWDAYDWTKALDEA